MGGLIPVVIQDHQDDDVLMVGFMNPEAWDLTKKTGKVHYYSRKKKRLWMKGEESGHFQNVKEIYLDNDNDTLLIKVKQIGGAVEDGYKSCFDKLLKEKDWVSVGKKIFDPKEVYENYSEEIVIAIPSGSLYSTVIMLFNLSDFQLELRGKRSLKPSVRKRDDIKIFVARAQEIPKLIESGQVDMGIVGSDMVKEYDANLTDLADLKFNESGLGPVSWVIAVPEDKKEEYMSLSDFENKTIATEIPSITKEYFSNNKVNVEIKKSVGATEGKSPFLADAIVDLCETGKSLKDNNLVPLFSICQSTAHIYAHNKSLAYGWKRRKMEEIVKNLESASKKLPHNPKKMIKLPNK